MPKLYCTECGKKLVKIGDAIRFDAETGSPVYEMVCPSADCRRPLEDRSFGNVIESAVSEILEGNSIIETGLAYFDKPAGGMTRGELTSLGGRPGHGKTTLMLNLLDSLSKKNMKVLLFNREMKNRAAIEKLLVLNHPVLTYDHMRKRVVEAGAKAEINHLVPKLKEKYSNVIMYDDIRGLTESLAAIKRHKPDIFIDDYIQLIRINGPKRDRRFDIEEIMNEYKWVAKKTNSAGLLISQLSRDVEKRLDHTPMMGDYAEGATIEHASENCMFIQHPYSFDPLRYGPESAEVIFKKVRYGTPLTAKIKFIGEKCRFEI